MIFKKNKEKPINYSEALENKRMIENVDKAKELYNIIYRFLSTRPVELGIVKYYKTFISLDKERDDYGHLARLHSVQKILIVSLSRDLGVEKSFTINFTMSALFEFFRDYQNYADNILESLKYYFKKAL